MGTLGVVPKSTKAKGPSRHGPTKKGQVKSPSPGRALLPPPREL